MSAIRVIRIVLITVAVVLPLAAEQSIGHPYYPLSVGNSWAYRVHRLAPQQKDSHVVWRVTKAEKNKAGGIVYQVWPIPMQADDEAMQLAVYASGIEELASHGLVLKWPLTSGDHWLGRKPVREVQMPPVFRVLSVGQACSVASKVFQDCAVVEENDQATGMRTITTYARSVGPVEYKYFRSRQGGKEEELQTVRLESYRTSQ